jgi:hypothetical protein
LGVICPNSRGVGPEAEIHREQSREEHDLATQPNNGSNRGRAWAIYHDWSVLCDLG